MDFIAFFVNEPFLMSLIYLLTSDCFNPFLPFVAFLANLSTYP